MTAQLRKKSQKYNEKGRKYRKSKIIKLEAQSGVPNGKLRQRKWEK